MKFKPNVDAEATYDDGDFRPLLGKPVRDNDWKLFFIGAKSVKDQLRGVLLPAHDYNLDLSDKAFASSCAPCWTGDTDRKNPRHFEPAPWGIPFGVYPYHGETGDHWFSPANKKLMIGGADLPHEETADAFEDLRRYVALNRELSEEDKKYYTEGRMEGGQFIDPRIPFKSTRFFSCCVCVDKNTPKPFRVITGYTKSAHDFMVTQMRWYRDGDTKALSERYPRYLLGDPTDPKGALVWFVDKRMIDSKGKDGTNCILWTRQNEILDDPIEVWPISDEDLAARPVLVDPANWEFPTYQEQVDYMVEYYDPAVTADMIARACGHLADVPPQREARNRPASGGDNARERQQDSDPIAAVTGQQGSYAPSPQSSSPPPPVEEPPSPVQRDEPAPVPPPAEEEPPVPPAPAGPPPANEESYWSGYSGQKSEKRTVRQLQAELDAGKGDMSVQVGGDWIALKDCPFVRASSPPPVQEEAPPVVGGPGVPATVPPSGGEEDRLRQARRNIFSDEQFEALTDDKKRAVEALVLEIDQKTNGGQSEPPPECVDKIIKILE